MRNPLPGLFLACSILLALGLLTADEAEAQIRASEPATFTQTIDGTEFRIDYYRPRTRGREPLFGGEEAVVWEHVWTPGANWATKFSFQKPIHLNGVEIPAGTYSVWVDMDENLMPEEFFLDPDTLIFHTMGPPPEDNQIRFPVELEDGYPFKELLTWDFEDINSRGGTLSVRWGTHRMAFDILVEPSLVYPSTAEQAAPVLGEYEAVMVAPDGSESRPFQVTFTQDADGVIHGDWEGAPDFTTGEGEDAWFNSLDMWLIPVPTGAEGWFIPGEAYDGILWETWEQTFFEFEPSDGPSPSFTIWDQFETAFMKGKRVN